MDGMVVRALQGRQVATAGAVPSLLGAGGGARQECGGAGGGRGAAAQMPSGIRLTRRGRVVAIGLLCSLPLLGFTAGRAGAGSEPLLAPPPVAVTVTAHDTLWGVATAALPHDDPRDAVEAVVRLNRLTSARLRPGQQLLLPCPRAVGCADPARRVATKAVAALSSHP